jgi:hypothetical protein
MPASSPVPPPPPSWGESQNWGQQYGEAWDQVQSQAMTSWGLPHGYHQGLAGQTQVYSQYQQPQAYQSVEALSSSQTASSQLLENGSYLLQAGAQVLQGISQEIPATQPSAESQDAQPPGHIDDSQAYAQVQGSHQELPATQPVAESQDSQPPGHTDGSDASHAQAAAPADIVPVDPSSPEYTSEEKERGLAMFVKASSCPNKSTCVRLHDKGIPLTVSS